MIQRIAIIGMGALGLLYADQIISTMGQDAVTFIMNQDRLDKYRNTVFLVNGQMGWHKTIGRDL